MSKNPLVGGAVEVNEKLVLEGIEYITGSTALSGAGAISITKPLAKWTTTGAQAGTLADGVEGQRLTIIMVVDGGDGTLTPSNLAGGTTITFDNNDTAELLFASGAWYVLGGTATVA